MILEKKQSLVLSQHDDDTPLLSDDIKKLSKIMIPLMPRYSGALREVGTKLEVLDDEFNMVNDHSPIHHIESRIKSLRSIYGKLIKNGFEISESSVCKNLYDIAGIRVICKYTNEIYRLVDLITTQDDIDVIRIRDYIKNPKENGYRSLHIILGVPVFLSNVTYKVPVEIQFRTIAMDMWASLEHEIRYKSGKEMKPGIAEKLRKCADTLAETDSSMQSIFLQMMD